MTKPKILRCDYCEFFVILCLLSVVFLVIVVPLVSKHRHAATRRFCANNLKQWGWVFNMYSKENRDLFPPGTRVYPYYDSKPITWLSGVDFGSLYGDYLTDFTIAVCPSAPRQDHDPFGIGGFRIPRDYGQHMARLAALAEEHNDRTCLDFYGSLPISYFYNSHLIVHPTQMLELALIRNHMWQEDTQATIHDATSIEPLGCGHLNLWQADTFNSENYSVEVLDTLEVDKGLAMVSRISRTPLFRGSFNDHSGPHHFFPVMMDVHWDIRNLPEEIPAGLRRPKSTFHAAHSSKGILILYAQGHVIWYSLEDYNTFMNIGYSHQKFDAEYSSYNLGRIFDFGKTMRDTWDMEKIESRYEELKYLLYYMGGHG